MKKAALVLFIFFALSFLVFRGLSEGGSLQHTPIYASGSGTANSTESGQVYVKTEDGDILYLDTATVPDQEYSRSYTVLGNKILIPDGFFKDLSELINRSLTLIIALSALLVFVFLIWGGVDWITSGGDKGKTESARQKIVAAVVGLIIVAASFAILTVALNFLGINSLEDALNTAVTENYQIIEVGNTTKADNLGEVINE